MPEIPEMEHYRQLLSQTVTGKDIIEVTVARDRSINIRPEQFTAAIRGGKINQVSRRAKYIILHLQNSFYLITHMMLDGRLYYGPTGMTEGLPGKPHVILDFSDGNSLFFCDLRLGFAHLVNQGQLDAIINELGLEPLDRDFTYEAMYHVYKGKRGAIKPLMLDQKVICGIGNAYSNEILFASGILPDRKVPSLEEQEMHRLFEAIPRVLRAGIHHGGYIEEPFAAFDRTIGGQNNHFMVYDRGAQPCKVCGTTIQEMKLNGRWTYFCTTCQH